MKLYTAPALAAEAGVTLRQVQHWTDRGHLKAVYVEGAEGGSGTRRIYERQEVEVAKLIGAFYDLGQVARLVRAAVEGHPTSLHGLTLAKTPVAP